MGAGQGAAKQPPQRGRRWAGVAEQASQRGRCSEAGVAHPHNPAIFPRIMPPSARPSALLVVPGGCLTARLRLTIVKSLSRNMGKRFGADRKGDTQRLRKGKRQ